ncbi:hypothetical protein Tco_1171694 [Tanacetum coccineum]
MAPSVTDKVFDGHAGGGNDEDSTNSYGPSAPTYGASSVRYSSVYSAPPLASSVLYPPTTCGAYSVPSTYSYPPTTCPSNLGVYPPELVYHNGSKVAF